MAYFTIPEFRQFMPDMSEAAYPDERVTFAQGAVEAMIEDACGTSFVERSYTDTLDGNGRNGLRIRRPYVRSVTSVTVDGVALTGYTFTFAGGMLERITTGSYVPVAWVCGRRNITVAYTAGYCTVPPGDLKLAAMEAVREKVIQLRERSGKPSDRATSITNEFGNYAMATADPDHPTGLPSADAVIMRYARTVRVPNVA